MRHKEAPAGSVPWRALNMLNNNGGTQRGGSRIVFFISA
jgi:hypothetical protein